MSRRDTVVSSSKRLFHHSASHLPLVYLLIICKWHRGKLFSFLFSLFCCLIVPRRGLSLTSGPQKRRRPRNYPPKTPSWSIHTAMGTWLVSFMVCRSNYRRIVFPGRRAHPREGKARAGVRSVNVQPGTFIKCYIKYNETPSRGALHVFFLRLLTYLFRKKAFFFTPNVWKFL